MSNYSNYERAIAGMLARFPFIKKIAKSTYSNLSYLIYRKKYKYKTKLKIKLHTYKEYNSFFGYYDKSPVNKLGYILVNITENDTRCKPSADKQIFLAVLKENKIVIKIPVSSYNWQQGCRAQWLDDNNFIFNDFDSHNNKYISRVFSIITREQINQFSLPVQDCYKKDFFISINYKRLMALRPDYGYRNLPFSSQPLLADTQNDGLWYVDMQTGESKLIISIDQACELKPIEIFDKALHKFNHVLISPNGKQLIFMHRYLFGKRRFDRLLLLNIEKNKLSLVNDYGMVSHCFWIDDKTVLGYMRGPGDIDAYWLVNINSLQFSRLPSKPLESLGDGHPHVCGDWFVTDTYPDKSRMQQLTLCNWKTGEVKWLGEFFHSFEFNGESRCDLHPRFSADGKKVFFDSVFTGKRQLYSMDINI